MTSMQDNIRNFCIIAHIDHGKSTLADRLLQVTHSVPERQFRDQMLDNMDLERERGITIKASAVTMFHKTRGQQYQFNLIDTPGHVDFSYEVSRSLRACEGAVLLVDAAQGVEAQTVANYIQARDHGLAIIPAVTKIDLPTARPIETMLEMESTLKIDPDDILSVSGKTGEHVEDVIDAIIKTVPAPDGRRDAPLRAIVFDSFYDPYQGVVLFVRVMDGAVERGDRVLLMASGRRYEADELGIFRPQMTPRDSLSCGEVGYLKAGIKNIREVRIGDTLTSNANPAARALPGYEEPRPMVYCGLFPQDNNDFEALRKALEKLSLNDSSFVFDAESSTALGFGFRCGFLGLLHMEIVQERLERESNVPLLKTAPNVTYHVLKKDGEVVEIDRPGQMPPQDRIAEVREPWVNMTIIVPTDYIGNVMKLAENRRGVQQKTEFFSEGRASVRCKLPLAEVIYDFFDNLKSVTRGFGTMDYEMIGYLCAELVKVDIVVNGILVDALSFVCHRDQAESRGRRIVEALRKKIDRHLFPVPIQAAVGTRVIARETIRALGKNVTAKCYGGDITRKRKLWEKQKHGKKRMKSVGSVVIPQEAFLAVLEGETGERS